MLRISAAPSGSPAVRDYRAHLQAVLKRKARDRQQRAGGGWTTSISAAGSERPPAKRAEIPTLRGAPWTPRRRSDT